MRKTIAEHKSILQKCNDDVQTSVGLTKKQNEENQEQHDQNRVLSRMFNKINKVYNRDLNGNSQLIRAVTKLEAIGYGYQRTFTGLARRVMAKTAASKSKSLIKRDSNGLEEFVSDQKAVGAFKSPSMGNLGSSKNRRKRRTKSKRKTRTSSKNRIKSENKFVMPNEAERVGRAQTSQVDKLMADWEGEYYNMMGQKFKSKTKGKKVTKKKRAASSKKS